MGRCDEGLRRQQARRTRGPATTPTASHAIESTVQPHGQWCHGKPERRVQASGNAAPTCGVYLARLLGVASLLSPGISPPLPSHYRQLAEISSRWAIPPSYGWIPEPEYPRLRACCRLSRASALPASFVCCAAPRSLRGSSDVGHLVVLGSLSAVSAQPAAHRVRTLRGRCGSRGCRAIRNFGDSTPPPLTRRFASAAARALPSGSRWRYGGAGCATSTYGCSSTQQSRRRPLHLNLRTTADRGQQDAGCAERSTGRRGSAEAEWCVWVLGPAQQSGLAPVQACADTQALPVAG